jgi:hypothetical protein
MRTEQELRRILALREELAPDPDAVMTGVRRATARRRRRRAAGAAIGAASAVVFVAALPGLVSALRSSPGFTAAAPSVTSPAPRPATPTADPVAPRPPFAFTVAAGPVGGYDLAPQSVSPDVQALLVRTPGKDTPRATLFVYRPGTQTRVGGDAPGWDVDQPGPPTPVQINGADGFYTTTAQDSALRWQYARDGWAVIGTNLGQAPMSQGSLVRLAEGVRFVAPYQARVPYRLDYLPADLVPFNVVQDTGSVGAFQSVVQLESGDQDHQRIVDITIADGSAWPRDWHITRTTIAGHSARCTDLVDGRRCAVDLKAFTVDLGCGSLTPSELSHLVAGLRPAVWTDLATWSEISAVFPHTS